MNEKGIKGADGLNMFKKDKREAAHYTCKIASVRYLGSTALLLI
jgi:hypothetical protein